VDCVCVCSSGALLVDLLEVNRSIDCDFLSVLFHPSFFFFKRVYFMCQFINLQTRVVND